MAEVSQDGGGGHHKKGGKAKQKKKSTKIDMTAMVDVAFLLLTFFILTTTMATPQRLELAKPPKTEDQKAEDDLTQDVKGSKLMTIILGKDDQFAYYVGAPGEPGVEPKTGDYGKGETGLRTLILAHIDRKPNPCKDLPEAQRKGSGCWDPIFVVKISPVAKYRNMVDILDELKLTEAPKQALAEFKDEDLQFMVDSGLGDMFE